MSEWYKDSDGYYVNEDYPNIFIAKIDYSTYHAYNVGWFVFSEIDGEKRCVDFKKQKDGYYKAVIDGPKQRFSSLKQAIEVVESADLSAINDTRYIRIKQIYYIFYKLCDKLPGCASALTSHFTDNDVVLELNDVKALEDYVVNTIIDDYEQDKLSYYQKDIVEGYLLKKK